MNTINIPIDNLKCHGCANTIRREISRLEGVQEVDISHEDSSVTITWEGAAEMKETFVRSLKKLGYPERGTGNTIDNVKSYVSCAIGRVKS